MCLNCISNGFSFSCFCIFNSFLACGLSFFNSLWCFVCFLSFLGMNFSHSFVSSFNDGLFFSFDAIINWFVNLSLLFNSFHFVCNISLLFNLGCSRCFVGIGNSSHHWGVWCLGWNWSWWKNLNRNLDWVWNRCFNLVWHWNGLGVCHNFGWSWNCDWYMVDMMMMHIIDMMVVDVIIPWTWCSSNLKNIINSSINDSLWCSRNTISLQLDSCDSLYC